MAFCRLTSTRPVVLAYTARVPLQRTRRYRLAEPASLSVGQEGQPGRAAHAPTLVGPTPAGGSKLPGKPRTDTEAEAGRCPALDRRTRRHEAGRSPDQERRGALRRDASDGGRVAGRSQDQAGASPDDPRRDQAAAPDDLLGHERAAAGRFLAARDQSAPRRELADGGR